MPSIIVNSQADALWKAYLLDELTTPDGFILEVEPLDTDENGTVTKVQIYIV